MNSAFLFPGQGCQAIGMGKDFYDNFTIAKDTFAEADDILSRSISKLIFKGPSEDLNNTKNAQVAIMVTSIAIYKVLMAEIGRIPGNMCKYMAGHSLGEYTAHAAAGSLSVKDCIIALDARGRAMNEACKPGVGAMAACIGISLTELEYAINGNITPVEICDVANDNSEGQIVISGHNGAIDKVIAALKLNGKKAIKLNVSAAFHSKLMQPAEAIMQHVLTNLTFSTPAVPIISNVSAAPITEPKLLCNDLITQICGRVRWRESINYLVAAGIDQFVEIGHGNVLSNLLRRALPADSNIAISNISNIAQLKEYIAKFA